MRPSPHPNPPPEGEGISGPSIVRLAPPVEPKRPPAPSGGGPGWGTSPLRHARVTFAEARRRAVEALRGQVADPAADARHLLAFAAQVPRDRLSVLSADPLPPGVSERLDAALAARLKGRSVAHVTGRAAFWGREFRVTDATLSPRPETETLIAAALEAPFERMIDLGTGTGCIGVTLLAERRGAGGTLTDLSPDALAVAGQNAARHGVAPDLALSDWWDGIDGAFDLVVSNPPYIAEDEMPGLSPEVLHEPRMALTPGGDGLDAYRAIAADLPVHLSPGGRVLLEIGPTQAAAVAGLLRDAGLEGVHVRADMDGRDRVVEARRPG